MKINLNKILAVLLLLTLIMSGCSTEESSFTEYVEQLFISEVEASPMDIHFTLANPAAFGLEHVRPEMPQINQATYNEDVKRFEEILKKLKSFNYKKLSKEEKLTYDILVDYYSTQLKAKNLYPYMKTVSPTLGIQAQLPIFFAEYRFDQQSNVDDYLKLLSEVPRLFEEIIVLEQFKAEEGTLMPTSALEAIINQIDSFILTPEDNFLIEIFEDKINGMTDLTDNERMNYLQQNKTLVLEKVIPAYDNLGSELRNLVGKTVNENGLYYLDKGVEYYEYLFSSYTGSSKTLDEAVKDVEDRLKKNYASLITIIQRNFDLVETYMSFTYDLTSPEDTISFLETAMLESFSSIGDQPLNIKYVHPSLEENLSPAFYLIPPIDENKTQVIYINKNEKYDLSRQLYTTLAHEGYPGHLYQIVYFRQQQNVPRIRQLLNYGGYAEGWATYAENFSIEFLDLDPNLIKILQLDSSLGLLIQARIDLGVHYEGWTLAETTAYLNTFMPGADSQAVYDYVLQEPGSVQKYAIGYLEFIELRELAEEKLSTLDLKEFHDFLLTIGPAPFGIIKEHLEQWINNKRTASIGSPLSFFLHYQIFVIKIPINVS